MCWYRSYLRVTLKHPSIVRKLTPTFNFHFNSNHPACHKRSFIKAPFGRVETHCSSEEARRQERACLYSLFNASGYPLNFIKLTLRQRPLPTPENTTAETPPLRPRSIRTDSQAPTTLQRQHRPEANEVLQGIICHRGTSSHFGDGFCCLFCLKAFIYYNFYSLLF